MDELMLMLVICFASHEHAFFCIIVYGLTRGVRPSVWSSQETPEQTARAVEIRQLKIENARIREEEAKGMKAWHARHEKFERIETDIDPQREPWRLRQ